MHSSRDKRDRTAYLIKIGLFRAAMTLCKLRASLSSEVFLKKQMVHFQSYDSSYHDFFTTPFYNLVNGNGHHRVLWIMEWHIKNVDRQHLLALLSLYKNNLASSWIYHSVWKSLKKSHFATLRAKRAVFILKCKVFSNIFESFVASAKYIFSAMVFYNCTKSVNPSIMISFIHINVSSNTKININVRKWWGKYSKIQTFLVICIQCESHKPKPKSADWINAKPQAFIFDTYSIVKPT